MENKPEICRYLNQPEERHYEIEYEERKTDHQIAPEECIENMKENGLRVGSTDQSVREIAENNGIPVGMVIEGMRK